MSYKIFFAYQTDSEDKFNKGFIHQASQNAIDKLKLEGYKIEFDYGFKKTPGTTFLIGEMLKKNDDADMVLVDLTLTSSKNWFFAKKRSFFGKTFAYFNSEIDKLSPNPNVLLETGYAWSKKGQYRTLIVMNTAFGNPEELPVDFKGFRWGITYTLDENNYKDRKRIREELSSDLYKAFKSSINSESSYQIELWTPFRINQQLQRFHSYPYVMTPQLKIVLSRLRELVINYKGPIRVGGDQGSGKSRLVYELFKKNGDLNALELENSILYFDLETASYGDISKKIIELGNLNQAKIVVLDNCSEQIHMKVQNEFTNSKVIFISIAPNNNIVSKVPPQIFLDESIKYEVFNVVVGERYPSISSSTLFASFKGDLRTLITFVLSGVREENVTKPAIQLIKFIIGNGDPGKKAFDLLQALSLFKRIGFSGEYISQIEVVMELFVGGSVNEKEEITALLESKNLISIRGDFILPNGFENELIEFWLEEPIPNINEIIIEVSKNKLWHNFFGVFIKCLNKPDNFNNILADGGVLKNIEFIDKDYGARFINMLAQHYPKEVLKVMEDKIKRL